MSTDYAKKRFSDDGTYLDVSFRNLDILLVCSSCHPIKSPCLFIESEYCKCLHTSILQG